MKKLAILFAAAVVVYGLTTKLLASDREAKAEAAELRAEGKSVVSNSDVQPTTSGNEQEADDNEPKVSNANANVSSTLPEGMRLPKYETSRGGQVIVHTGYTVKYDADYKTPQWVAWSLTAEQAEGTVPREKNFYPDPDVRGAKAYPKDYANSGYDRGHMAPAGDMKWSETAMKESFYMSNMCPQNRNLNRGDWKELEELERDWAVSHGVVNIAAGPIYYNVTPTRIGNNKVAVPDAFFKVILVDYPDAPKAYGFIFKNEAGSRPLSTYQLTVNEVEKVTGMDFFPGLSEKVESQKPALTKR